MEKHQLIKKWVNQNTDALQQVFPDVNRKDLKNFLKVTAEREVVNPKAQLHNNYAHKKLDIDLLSVVDWFWDTKPIAGGFGVFYKNQDQEINPNAVMLMNFMELRKKFKSQLPHFTEGSYDYMKFDRLQMSEKINSNS